ncbi:M1 family aminopeptidase [Kaistella jeonii]|uniref:Aminopeptidase N n=1 Tax=Kaistella jeonii TaxID=266749 RepID=A0A0C1F6J9_9FLAO|nr:M1 family aminopeptidase [Kaistella jeonii]KIA88817.1 peptidase M1 [Kaistella jeonii]SFC14070.1 Por secretion system C-terminal sorting domain-containing protein [Kaistella jeonii]VEI97450.1 Aminopeptidase N [Kaistella jeonii]
MKKLYFLILTTLFSVSLFSQAYVENKTLVDNEVKNYEKMINFNVNPNTLNYDLKYQRMEVNLDPAILQISGSVTSHFLPNSAMSSIYFDFTDQIPVSEILYHGTNLNFQQLSTKELKIDFPTTLPANTLDSLTVKYSGVPDNSGRTSFYVGNHSGSPVMSTLSEPYGAQNWFPTKQSMNDKIDRFDMKITTPELYSVASNGKLMSENLIAGNKKVTFWRTQYPTAAYLIAFSIGEFVKTTDVMGNTSFPYVNYLYPDTSANSAIQNNLEWTKQCMTIFENYFGPYPFSNEKYGHMEFAVNGACMEHQTMSSMSSFGKTEIAHELSHQWFGDKITCGSWNEAWLNEGFATFAEHVIFEKNIKTHAEFMAHLSNQINVITSLPNGKIYVNDTDLGNVATVFSGRLTYVKGGFTLRMIKWILGDDVFYQMLKDYTSNPAFIYKYVKTEDFKNQILTSTGKDFTEFFNDWIYGQGYPTYTIKWNQPVAIQDIKFLVSQTQSDPSVSFFKLPLPIRVTGTNGEIADLVLDNTSNSQSFSKAINFEVATVEFNKEYEIIEKNSTVIFDAALATDSNVKDDIVLFPNPVKDQLSFKGISKVSPFEIYSLDGKLIKKGNYKPSSFINISTFNSGIYFIKIDGKNIKFSKN